MARKQLLSLVLLAACGGLALWIAQQWQNPDPLLAENPGEKTYQSIDIPAVEQFMPPPLDNYSEMVERPLFWASRRPPAAAAESAPETVAENEPVSPPQGYRLTGVVISEGQPLALLSKGQDVLRLREGEALDGWEIAEITPREIILRNDEHRLAWELFEKDAQAGGPMAQQQGINGRRVPGRLDRRTQAGNERR